MFQIGGPNALGGRQAWIVCERCEKTLCLTVYPGETAESELREEARDEGWHEESGKWYCNECDDQEGV